MTENLPGLDLARLARWLPSAGIRADALTAKLLVGGKSNLTYAVTDGAQSWILRRPPVGHLLATAHDMAREYRVMTALNGTAVPVPATFAMCTDDGVLGAPFYLMEHVAGTPYRFEGELAPLGPARVQMISERLVDTLVALHSVVPEEVGLEGFGNPEGFLARQVNRWKKQLDASSHRELPGADDLYAKLSATVPAQSCTGIVHGDYRLDNVLIDDAGEPAAVLDWEMATLGDPLTDLALMLTYHRIGAATGGAGVTDAANAAGFLPEGDIIARYQERSGRDLSGFGFYIGLASFKLAGILEGIHDRFVHGQTVGEGFERIGDLVEPLLEVGLAAADDL